MKNEIYNILLDIIMMNQVELKRYLINELVKYYDDINYTNGGIIANGYNNQLTLVAHMDRHPYLDDKVEDIITDGNIISSPNGIAGDDRCGIAIILYVIRNGYRPNIIFTEDEEIGCVGTLKMLDNVYKFDHIIKTSNYLLQLDRKSTCEAVFYGYDNQLFIDYILQFGFDEKVGSSTDIRKLREPLNLAAVNISVGYENAHSFNEIINLDHLVLACAQTIDMIEDNEKNNFKFKFEEEVYYG